MILALAELFCPQYALTKLHLQRITPQTVTQNTSTPQEQQEQQIPSSSKPNITKSHHQEIRPETNPTFQKGSTFTVH